ncbi:unnamed protein product [Protopolystoma xenopodis]|uniref:Uncharacterized protein n=1 Tax=Protopolystoma xenopodis TaxID=117903 RepID=A0A3S5BC75_9PLAT|nr:unnamed protein product [Protopolystoma xenopodis]
MGKTFRIKRVTSQGWSETWGVNFAWILVVVGMHLVNVIVHVESAFWEALKGARVVIIGSRGDRLLRLSSHPSRREVALRLRHHVPSRRSEPKTKQSAAN